MWRPRTLAQRVFLSTAIGSLSAVAIVAPVTVVLANQLARNQEDEHLRSAAETLAYELHVKHYDPLFAVHDETRELAHTAIVVALFENGRRLAGEAELPFVPPGTCQSSAKLRVCAVAAEGWVVAAARAHTRLQSHADVTLMAAGIALLATSILSLVLAFVLARAAVRPLDKLSRALAGMPADLRETVDLGPASEVHEVETLRASLQGVFESLRRALLHSHSFAGDAAHQLRTPLAAITAELDLALEVAPDTTRRFCQHARDEAVGLSRLIDRLLVLAMPEDTIRAWMVVSSAAVFDEALAALPQEQRARIACSGNVQLEADPVLLQVAIVGALEHALQSAGGRLRLQAEVKGSDACLVIEHERAPRPSDDGIWLAVWRRVASLHGGRASVAEGQARPRIELTIPRVRSRAQQP